MTLILAKFFLKYLRMRSRFPVPIFIKNLSGTNKQHLNRFSIETIFAHAFPVPVGNGPKSGQKSQKANLYNPHKISLFQYLRMRSRFPVPVYFVYIPTGNGNM